MNKIAAALACMLVALVATPAFAQAGASTKITSPGDGSLLSSTVGVSGTASASTGVRNAKMFIENTLVASAEPSNLRQNVDLNYNWDTTRAFGGGIARNGWYQIRIEVTATGGDSASSKVNVKVDNGVQTPSNFTGSVQGSEISLTWSANPEPDIIGYRVEMASGGEWAALAQVGGTSHSATLDPGTYGLRVVALRSSPVAPNGRPSAPSPTVTLTIAAPAGGGEGSGGASGNGGGKKAPGAGDPRVFGRGGTASPRDVRNTARAFAGGGFSFGGLALPGQAGLPDLPSSSQPFKWGTYKEELPYSLPQGGAPLENEPPRLAALSTTRIIPMDALRWVGAGILMIVVAALLQFAGWRAETIARLGADGAALRLARPRLSLPKSLPKVALPAVSFTDAHVRLRRIQDRVRAAWTKARSS